MKSSYTWAVCVLWCVAALGCAGSDGPATEPVTGVVTLDGQPVENADVVFSPVSGGQAAAGKTDGSGRFRLTTHNPNDGAVQGEYKVKITKTVGGAAVDVNVEGLSEEEAMKKSMEAYYSSEAYKDLGNPKAANEVKNELPAKYGDTETSGLTATVKDGDNQFEFALRSEG